MTIPYLILHKVRGEPAFDIAIKLCGGDRPCQPNCGQWDGEACAAEDDWIIPTSGHKAHPIWFSEIAYDGIHLISIIDTIMPKMPPDWPDHYACNNKPAKAEKSFTSTILDKLGLTPKINRRI